MPLKLNIGLRRKVGEPNCGSRGASVNLELELDSGLLSDPPRLREPNKNLFGLVKVSLPEEPNGGLHPPVNGEPAREPLLPGADQGVVCADQATGAGPSILDRRTLPGRSAQGSDPAPGQRVD